MYIRRKVFSLLLNEEGLEKYFSTTEFELDDDISERYYSEEEETPKKKGLSKKAKIALGIGATTLATAGAIYGGKKAGAALAKKGGKYAKVGENLQKPADYVVKGANATKRGAGKAWNAVKGKFSKKGK